MSDINLTKLFQSKMVARPRVRGRYSSSELYFILSGSTTPEAWFTPKQRTVKENLTMWAGTGAHAQLEELMGKEHAEKKTEYKYKDIVLVGKLDFQPPHKNEIWEWKTSEKKMKNSKPWHDFQLKLYLTMFGKPIGKIYQPIQDDNGLYLKHLGTVERDDAWFESQLVKLYEFHLKVEELWKNKK